MSAGGPAPFEVRLRSRRVQQELDRLSLADFERVLARLRDLAADPRPPGVEKLYDDIHRIRVGDWRIIYLVDDARRRVDVGAIRRRSERTYRGIEELFR